MVMGSQDPGELIEGQQLVKVGPVPHAIRSADFDGDGDMDLVILFAGSPAEPGGEYARSATVLFGEGDGTLRTPFVKVLEAPDPDALLEVGDLDGNGWIDIAVVSPGEGTIQIAWNVEGTFGAPEPAALACGEGVQAIAAADLEGDGAADLALAYAGEPGDLEVWRFPPGGDPPAVERTPSAFDPRAVRIADLEGDGSLEAVVLDGAGALLAHRWAAGRFAPPDAVELPGAPTSLALADLDGDGRLDAIVAYRGEGWLAVLLGRPTETPPSFRRGDFDADGTYTIADAIAFLNFLFAGAAPGPCPDAADADDDGRFTLADGIGVLSYLFAAGPAPPPPGTSCGPDPTPDGLEAEYGPCAYPAESCP